MLKTATTVLTISLAINLLIALFVIFSPETIGGSTLEARSGKTLKSLEQPEVADTIVVQTRTIGIYALATVIAFVFILFTGFKKGEKWAWWAFLIVLVVCQGYGIVLQIIEGDTLNLIIHLVVSAFWIAGLLIPVKVFFAKQSS